MDCTRWDAKRDEGLTEPEDIEIFDSVQYSDCCALDVYLPKNRAGKLPVIVHIHGGGFVYGSKEVYRYYLMSIAQRGFAVVNFDYRLAPEDKFPAPLEDTNEVMRFVLENADRYGFDTENIFAAGDSAGAQLCSQYAAMCTNEKYARIMGITPPEGLKIRAVGLNCGLYSLSEDVGGLGYLLDAYLPDDIEKDDSRLDVLSHITGDFPPSYLFSAKGDFLLSECEPMAKLLMSRGVEAEYKIYGDGQTGHVFHVNIRLPSAQQANDDETEFFKRHIK